jgi:UTP:GlnB (protein PII) uridylyltransferase
MIGGFDGTQPGDDCTIAQRPIAAAAPAGDAAVHAALRARLGRTVREQRHRMLDLIRALVAERHARFNDTLEQLAPDVKDAPSGLRDAAAARWFRDLSGRGAGLHHPHGRAGHV